MKFNKEKTKKFQKGGKTPKEIMEEARRNQAIERQAQTRDIVSTSGIPAYQSRPVTIQAPRQELVLKEFAPSQPVSFSQAFAEARKAGLKEFTWQGKRFTTDLADTAANTPVVNSPTVNDITYDGGVLPELVVTAPAPKIEGQTQQRDWSQVQAPNRDPGTIRADHRPKRIDWGWLRRRLMGLNQGSILYQQGGQLPKFQQGDKLPLRSWLERFFRVEPNYTPVNSQESITSYMDNTLRGPVEKRVIRKEVPYANLHSTMSIRNPGTNRADTTFTAPSGTKYKMDDVRSGKAPSGYSYKFFEKPVGYFQQGGTIENEESGSTDQLYVDFAIRYLKAKGISEDDMVDDEGGLRDEFVEEVTTAINEVDSPDFWEQYQSNPDAAIQSYIESKMEPEQIEMAKKGAKLKKLKSKQKRCKCGCSMEIHEEGGKITETCTCCGNKITKHQSGGLFNSIYNPKENNPKNFKATSIFSEVKGQKNPTYHNMNRDGKFIHPTPVISEIIQDGDTIYRTGSDWTMPTPRLGRANTTEGARSNSPYREDYERAKNYFYNLYNNSEALDIIQEGSDVRKIRDSLRSKYNFKRIYGK